jgi:hypothetical protein
MKNFLIEYEDENGTELYSYPVLNSKEEENIILSIKKHFEKIILENLKEKGLFEKFKGKVRCAEEYYRPPTIHEYIENCFKKGYFFFRNVKVKFYDVVNVVNYNTSIDENYCLDKEGLDLDIE